MKRTNLLFLIPWTYENRMVNGYLINPIVEAPEPDETDGTVDDDGWWYRKVTHPKVGQ